MAVANALKHNQTLGLPMAKCLHWMGIQLANTGLKTMNNSVTGVKFASVRSSCRAFVAVIDQITQANGQIYGKRDLGTWSKICGRLHPSIKVNVHMMVANLEDKKVVKLGSGHNLIDLVCSRTVKSREGDTRKEVKWKVDGRQDREEYQHGVQEKFLDWEDKLKELAKSKENEKWVEGVWELNLESKSSKGS